MSNFDELEREFERLQEKKLNERELDFKDEETEDYEGDTKIL
jgi:hypothetical protein